MSGFSPVFLYISLNKTFLFSDKYHRIEKLTPLLCIFSEKGARGMNYHTEVSIVAIEAVTKSQVVYQANETQVKKSTPATERTNVEHKDVVINDEPQDTNRTAIQDGKTEKTFEDEKAADNVAANSQIRKAVEELNKKMFNSEAIFGIHEDTKRLTIKIVDKDTKEVIREFPPEETLDMIAKVWELAGVMVDEKR